MHEIIEKFEFRRCIPFFIHKFSNAPPRCLHTFLSMPINTSFECTFAKGADLFLKQNKSVFWSEHLATLA